MKRSEWVEYIRTTQPQRLRHCLGAESYAVALAKQYGVDPVRAAVAGLLHDCAKPMPLEQQRALAAKWQGIDLEDWPQLVHAHAGAVFAREHFGITDGPVLSAIAMHAPAQPGWDKLGCIIYLADKLEPTRSFRGIDRLREAVKADLLNGLRLTIADETAAIMRYGYPVHPMIIAAWNQYAAKRASTDQEA
nr:bis(5'-nucleosyl)-tetraphosphatase (symmetrical) YqeK [bacterium]